MLRLILAIVAARVVPRKLRKSQYVANGPISGRFSLLTPLHSLLEERSTSIPFAWRTLLLASAFFLVLVFNADHVRGQTPDDHSDNPFLATLVPLGSSVAGRIDPSTDTDLFVFDLSDRPGPTDVWIYATGDLDSIGGLFDSDLDLLLVNDDGYIEGSPKSFHIRAILDPDYYFVLIRSFGRKFVGDYTLHIEPAPDHGGTIDTATELEFPSSAAGRFDARGDDHFFRLDLTEQTDLLLSVRNPVRISGGEFLPVAPIDFIVFDAEGEELSVNVYPLGITTSGRFTRYGFRIEDDFTPGAYYVQMTTPDDYYETTYPVFYTVNALENVAYTEFIDGCETMTESLDDPSIADSLYACQWHLDQPNGEDIDVEPVWDDGITGEGVNVVVVDTGMDWTHEDLFDNVDTSLNHDYTGESDIHHPFSHHGSKVTGLIAARDNDVGVRGVAPRATIYGYNLLAGLASAASVSLGEAQIADSMGRNADVTAVSNNSWGAVDGPGASPSGALWQLAVENGVTRGYDGRGVFYVWAAGNGHADGDDGNLDGRGNFYAVTAVCAVNEAGMRSLYSEMGANLWVCAPSSRSRTEQNYRGIVTVDNSDQYIDDFGGTSAATPIVAGVAALVRQANPDLTWRDLKLVLAGSARRNDATNPGWEDGARTYGSYSDRYHFNHEYGFGVVDAAAAVDLAKSWPNLPPMRETSAASAKIDRLIPDAYDAASIETITLTLDIDSDIEFTEFVEIDTVFQHNSFRDLDIELESPSGAVSRLVPSFDTFTDDGDPDNDYLPLRGPYRFGSAKHLGEDPNGVWTLRITDIFRLGIGAIESWGITVYGHTPENVPPSFSEGETTTRSVAENTPAGDPVGDPVAADHRDTLEYTLAGPDAALFDIDPDTGQIAVGATTTLDYEDPDNTGQIAVGATTILDYEDPDNTGQIAVGATTTLDYEDPDNTGQIAVGATTTLDYEDPDNTDHEYQVTVTATDPSGATATITVTITVTDVSLGELGDTYDADHDETISRDEVIQAITDYLDGLITREQVLEIINLYVFS